MSNTGIGDFLSSLTKNFQYDLQWVVKEISNAVHMIETVGVAVEVDINGIFHFVSTHQKQILADMEAALNAISLLGSFVPSAAAEIAAAQTAINVATAAVNVLADHAKVGGNTPISAITNAVHTVVDARNAVNAVVKHATPTPAKPATVPAK